MKILGITAEYNPFHDGHRYQIKKAREESGADFVVAVMSGYFVQRGEPAIFDPYVRARTALSDGVLSGVDAVFMMPVRYSTSSAEGFADCGVSVLDKLGCDCISFGSECGDINQLESVTDTLPDNASNLTSYLQSSLANGVNYAAAMQLVLSNNTDFSLTPNDILGIEYLKALRKYNSSMVPYVIKRSGEGHNETASMLRSKIYSSCDEFVSPDDMTDFMLSVINEKLYCRVPLTDYMDVREDLANRISDVVLHNPGFDSYEDFVKAIKTKNYTYARISRCLVHILLEIRKESSAKDTSFVQLIGFRKDSSELLSELKKRSGIQIVSKPADYKDVLSEDAYASNIYNRLFYKRYGKTLSDFYQRQIVIV